MKRTTGLLATSAGILTITAALIGCGSTTAAKAPAAPPVSTSAPAATSVTDANGLACVAFDNAGYCPGDDPSAPAAPPSSDSPFGMDIGTPVHMTDDDSGATWDVTLNSVHRFSQGQYDDPAPAGTHYIRINVTYDVTAGSVDMNEWDWTAKDAGGTIYEVQMVDAGSNGLSANTIQSGKTRGTVVLAMTDGSAGTVVYSAGDSEQASWNIPSS